MLLSFSHSVMSDSLWAHGLQHARLPCPSVCRRVCSNSYPLSQWCHPIISSSVAPFSSCPQSFPTSGSFPMGWLFALGVQRTGTSASASVLPMNIQGIFFRIDWFDLHAVQGTLKSLLQHRSSKTSIHMLLIIYKIESCSVTSNSLGPHGLYSPWNSPGQNTRVGNLSLLQGIFPTQGSKPGLLHCRQILYHLGYWGSPSLYILRNFIFVDLFFSLHFL